MKLAGQVAIVTGAARGIGRGVALRLAKDGADVVVNDINEDSLNNVVEEIKSLGRKSLGIVADISNGKEVNDMVDQVVNEFGKLDIMVANAGIVQVKSALDVTEEELDRILAINTKGTYLCDQAAARHMIKQKKGKIINCASISGHSGSAFFSTYCASKFAVVGMTQALAKELGPHGITVNAYCPGIVDTNMWEDIDALFVEHLDRPKGEAMKKYMEPIALGRVETPEDVAGLVSYLASSDADYMTGQSLNICGGILLS